MKKLRELKKFCVVIPVYKEYLTPEEEMCLKRMKYVFGEVDNIYLICPLGIDTSAYSYIYPSIKVIPFNKRYFKSTATYSTLCMSPILYKTFFMYEYMVIAQLDAFVVRNDIAKFCDMGYDYIGAPIYTPNIHWKIYDNSTYKVGNGGFSLRKISKFIEICSKTSEYRKSHPGVEWDAKYEDAFFCASLPDNPLNIAPVDIATKFACDRNPNIHQKLNDNKLPTAIHAIGMHSVYWADKISEITPEIATWCVKHYYGKTLKIRS